MQTAPNARAIDIHWLHILSRITWLLPLAVVSTLGVDERRSVRTMTSQRNVNLDRSGRILLCPILQSQTEECAEVLRPSTQRPTLRAQRRSLPLESPVNLSEVVFLHHFSS